MAQYFMVADLDEARTVLDLARVIVEAREGPKSPTRKMRKAKAREPLDNNRIADVP